MFTLLYNIVYAITYALGAVITAPVLLFMQIVVVFFNILGISPEILP